MWFRCRFILFRININSILETSLTLIGRKYFENFYYKTNVFTRKILAVVLITRICRYLSSNFTYALKTALYFYLFIYVYIYALKISSQCSMIYVLDIKIFSIYINLCQNTDHSSQKQRRDSTVSVFDNVMRCIPVQRFT